MARATFDDVSRSSAWRSFLRRQGGPLGARLALAPAITSDPPIWRRLMRYFQGLAPPSTIFEDPEVMAAVRRIAPSEVPRIGPEREEMVALLEAAVSR